MFPFLRPSGLGGCRWLCLVRKRDAWGKFQGVISRHWVFFGVVGWMINPSIGGWCPAPTSSEDLRRMKMMGFCGWVPVNRLSLCFPSSLDLLLDRGNRRPSPAPPALLESARDELLLPIFPPGESWENDPSTQACHHNFHSIIQSLIFSRLSSHGLITPKSSFSHSSSEGVFTRAKSKRTWPISTAAVRSPGWEVHFQKASLQIFQFFFFCKKNEGKSVVKVVCEISDGMESLSIFIILCVGLYMCLELGVGNYPSASVSVGGGNN